MQECVKKKQAVSYRESVDLPNGEKHFITQLTPVLKDGEVKYIFGEKLDSTFYINELKKNQLYEKTISENSQLMQKLFIYPWGLPKVHMTILKSRWIIPLNFWVGY